MRRRPKQRIARSAREGYDINLPSAERALLKHLPLELERALGEIVGHDDAPESLRRLLPPAYLTDAASEASYMRLARDDLIAHHREALATLASTADANHLDDDETDAWLSAVNNLRLMIGSSLGVTEETREIAVEDPNYSNWICYQYLSYLESEIIEAVAGALPEDEHGAQIELPEDPWGEPPGGLRWDGTYRPEEE